MRGPPKRFTRWPHYLRGNRRASPALAAFGWSTTDRSPLTALATSIRTTSLLHFALRLDAVVTAAVGVAYLAAPGPLEDLLGVPSSALLAVGAFMVAYGAVVWLVARAQTPNRLAVRIVIGGNVVWVLDSLAVAALDWGSPSTAGTVWIVLQALTVAAFAALQTSGLRRARA